MQRVESGRRIPRLRAADPVILINLVDLPAGTLGDLPQLALLIGRGLVDCGNPEVESGAFHGKSPHLSADTVSDLVRKIYSFCTPEIGIHKPLILLIVACGILRGFFHTNRLIVVFDRYRRRRRQLLWRRPLNLATTIWPDDVALEDHFDAESTVRIRRS